MPVKFISHVDQNRKGGWFIELTDTLEGKTVTCHDMDEYKQQIEQLGGEYGGEINVEWTKSDTLSPANYQALISAMEALAQEYEEEIKQMTGQNDASEGGFDPNA